MFWVVIKDIENAAYLIECKIPEVRCLILSVYRTSTVLYSKVKIFITISFDSLQYV